MFRKKINSTGFTLLELLIVMAILAILGTISVGYFGNFARSITMTELETKLASDLKEVRAKSINGEGDLKWGAHFVSGVDNYYELFSTPTDYASPSKTVTATNFLSNGIVFTTPSAGNNIDIIFDKIYGSTTPAAITIFSSGIYATTTISSNGNIN